MTKNMIKVLAILLTVIMFVTVIATTSNAAGNTLSFANVDTDSVTAGAEDNTGAASSIQRIIGSVLTIVQVVGMGVAVIMLIVLAIKYISAAPGDKADIKKHAVVYVVGAVVLFAATGILQIVKNLAGAVHGD